MSNYRFNQLGPILGVAILGAVLAVFMVMPAQQTSAEGEPAAVVNDTVISQAELQAELINRHGEQVLQDMIHRLLIRQAAAAEGAQVTQADVDGQFEEIRSQFASQEEFQAAMAQANVTESSLRQEIELELLMKDVLADQITVTEAEARELYEQHQAQFEGASFAEVRDIVEQNLEQQKLGEASSQWLGQQLEQADIDILLPGLE